MLGNQNVDSFAPRDAQRGLWSKYGTKTKVFPKTVPRVAHDLHTVHLSVSELVGKESFAQRLP